MKKILFIIGGLFMAAQTFAQDCSTYLYMQKGKTIEMTGFNKNGDVTMKSVSTVSDVSSANGVTTASVSSQAFDKNGKSTGTGTIQYTCTGGVITMQMHMDPAQGRPGGPMNMNMTMTSSGGGDYPPDMKVGDHLKDYTTTMNPTADMSVTISVTDRTVAAKESVTTPAGTFDCFKITYNSSSVPSFKGMKMPSHSSASTVWYAANAGMVKMEFSNGYMEITSIK